MVAVGGHSFIDPLTGVRRTADNQLLQSPAGAKLEAPRQQHLAAVRPTSGRLIDQIAVQASGEGAAGSQPALNKLDYIIDFMRANKLTKFCDLFFAQNQSASRVASGERDSKNNENEQETDGEMVEQLKRQLNSLNQFTLFVPTNEAFDLMPGHLAAELSSAELRRRFLLAHATGELVVPKYQVQASASQRSSQGQLEASDLLPQRSSARWTSGRAHERVSAPSSISLAYSLAGNQLRVVTAPLLVQAQNRSTKLDLIVNGANVLSGHSHALQEPNNSSATYAIVHLLDRPLWPPVQSSLMELIDRKSPHFGKLVRLARDARLLDTLEQGANAHSLLTVFLPTEQALMGAPSKLFDRLETNRTFLAHFLRSHLVESLYYSGQLSNPSGLQLAPASQADQSPAPSGTGPRELSSLAGTELSVETKSLPTRQLLLVNGVALVEQDLGALNGVVHLLARPLDVQAEPCPCESSSSATLASEQVVPKGLLNSTTSGSSNSAGDQLEREESTLLQKRVRSQRSESLVSRINKDFYRPSSLPANLQLVEPTSGGGGGGQLVAAADKPAQQSRRRQSAADSLAPPVAVQNSTTTLRADLFDAERYKVVLNASSRQRMREQQQLANLSQASSAAPPQAGLQFAYDKPLSQQADSAQNKSSSLGGGGGAGNKLRYSVSESVSVQEHRSRANSSSSKDQVMSASSQQQQRAQRLLKFQAEDARDQVAPGPQVAPRVRPAQLASPPAYDLLNGSPSALDSSAIITRRQQQQAMFGKTVAPPQAASPTSGCAFYDATCRRLVGKTLVRLPPTNQQQQQQRPSASSRAPQMFDSTFGETTTASSVQQTPATTQPGLLGGFSHQTGKSFASPSAGSQRLSALSQPLPPWDSRDEQRRGHSSAWPSSVSPELSRIRFNSKQANWSAPSTIQGLQPDAPILLVPVKMFQDASMPLGLNRSRVMFQANEQAQQVVGGFATNSLGAPKLQQPQWPTAPHQFQSGRLSSNLSAYEAFDEPSQQQSGPNKNDNHLFPGFSASRKQQERPAAEHTKRLVRLHAGEPLTTTVGDTSVTLAKLVQQQQVGGVAYSKQQLAPAGQQLASAASNDQLQAAPSSSETDSANQVDFFQNRTIAEIMDDSGLRIDGQQVTFNRLRDCLERADLLTLVGQPNGSPLVIFMPTDSAFQRLVQQQAVVQQARNQPTGAPGSRLSARLVDPMRRHLLPLIALSPSSGTSVESPSGGGGRSGRLTSLTQAPTATTTTSGGLEPPASDATLALSSRLTLDCSAPQVRQLLLDHLSGQLVTPKQLTGDQAIATLSGRRLLLSSVPQKKIVIVDGQPVIAATRAKNGMVYVVNKFLNISEQMGNVVDLLEKQPQLSTFHSYLTYSSLADRLKRGKRILFREIFFS